ncbi:MAG: chloride channel protein, partial [Peptococcaceae bacterium]|nr:chloride channel protein [Peptococcaceae bacterium]
MPTLPDMHTPDWKTAKDKAQFQIRYSSLYISWFLRWLIYGTITGIVCGLAGAAFHVGIDLATEAREGLNWLLFLLPFAGLLIVFSYHRAGLRHDPGTNLVLKSIQGQKHIPIRMAPLIFCGTILTHLCGGSSGRVGAALQIGGSIGEGLGHVFRLKEGDIKIIIICGMSAVFATLFGTPVAAAVFTMEVISVGVIHYSAFVPSIISASIAYGITQRWDVTEAVFPLLSAPEYSILLMLKIILLAMICGAVSILFCVVMHRSVELFTRLIPNDYIRVFAGGCAVIVCTLLVGTD